MNAQGAIGDGGSSSAGGGPSSFGLSAVRNAMVEWSLNVGDDVLQVVEGKFGGGGGENRGTASGGSGGADKKISEHILVLCEHSVFLLKVSCLWLRDL